MTIDLLTSQITELDRRLKHAAAKSVNYLLTSRNWLIGFYLVEYEHSGDDRAEYGKALTEKLAKQLNTKGLSARNLWLFRQFYLAYPQIGLALQGRTEILQSPLAESEDVARFTENEEGIILHSASAESSSTKKLTTLPILQSVIAELNKSEKWAKTLHQLPPLHVPGEKLLEKLSYTHLSILLPIEDPLQRTFYEIESIKGTWSVRELKRQISSLYFERSGMSKSPEILSEITQEKAISAPSQHLAKDLYTFEFLNLPTHLAVEESELETALLGHLEAFLLELGHGFCFEARQKRLLIGDEYYFVDLVLYHRILKCHVLIELKVGAFSHENAGQLNTYLNYYRAEICEPSDNPPVGILLVADQNKALVEYATAGMDENLFVREYMLQLPSKETLRSFLEKELTSL